MSRLRQVLMMLGLVIVVTASVMAQGHALGTKLFDDGLYPCAAGTSGKISFYAFQKTTTWQGLRLCLGDPATHKLTPLDPSDSNVSGFGTIAWSRDGNSYLAVRRDLSPCDIYKYELGHSTPPVKLTDLTPLIEVYTPEQMRDLGITKEMLLDVMDMDWSADGKKVAMTLLRLGKSAVWVLDVATGQMKQVTEDRFGYSPTWSADGQLLYFSGLQKDTDRPTEEIFSVQMSDYKVTPVITGPTHDNQPQVSPDGRYIAFCRMREANPALYIYDIKVGKAACLVDPGKTGACRFPTWTGDGKALIYQYNSSGIPDIYRVDFTPAIFQSGQ